MLFGGVDRIVPVVGSAGSAVLFTGLTQHLASRQDELSSEILCWILFPFLFSIPVQPSLEERFAGNIKSKTASPTLSLWVVAACITMASIYKAEIGPVRLYPALTPLLLIAEQYLHSDPSASKPDKKFFAYLSNTVWGTAVVAFFAVFTLSDWNHFDPSLAGFALSTVPVAALLLVYVALTPKAKTWHTPIIADPAVQIYPLSCRVLALLAFALGLQTYVFGFPEIKISSTLLLGFVKALSWYSTIRTVSNYNYGSEDKTVYVPWATWRVATAIATFSMVATRDPSMQASQLQGYALVLASCLALGQVIQMLGPSKKMRARSTLWVFVLVSLVPYMVSIYTANQAQSLVPRVHPLEAVIVDARMEFEGMLARQSKNYHTAEREYRRRHGIDPPPGFQEWYMFAREYQSPVIDEFDMILESIRPFLRVSGKEINTMIKKAANTPNVELWDCNFSLDRIGTGSNTTECTHPWRTNDRHFGLMFDRLLKDIPKRPLDVRFLVNHLDEPRVLIPPSSGSDKGRFQLTNLTQKSTWDAITKHCPSNTDKGGRVEGAFTFITNNSQAMDLCAHPEYKNMHGLFVSPTSFGLIEGLVPVLSTGAPSTMGDILFPSPAYNVESDFRYDKTKDRRWEEKKNELYWAGSTTGGFVSDRSWTSFHRQRFVSLAQNLEPKQHTYLQESSKGVVEQKKTSFWNGRLFDVSFTRIFQCARKTCHDQRQHFRTRNWADKDEAMKYKLAFDLDGNGISGRYYKLLASKSVPLKQTVLKEWHDERLIPWVHYVPVSLGMEELPEVVFWLTSTKAGQERAKTIAEQGREWYKKAFREVDMGIYVYRLMLELARVQDPGREAFAV